MAEYIEREALVRILNAKAEMACGTPKDVFYSVSRMVELLPAADVAEVVRCKGCKHWLKDVACCTDFVGRCEWANYMVGANGYCVYGEKMEGNGEGE
jgi:hypothetical protein